MRLCRWIIWFYGWEPSRKKFTCSNNNNSWKSLDGMKGPICSLIHTKIRVVVVVFHFVFRVFLLSLSHSRHNNQTRSEKNKKHETEILQRIIDYWRKLLLLYFCCLLNKFFLKMVKKQTSMCKANRFPQRFFSIF